MNFDLVSNKQYLVNVSGVFAFNTSPDYVLIVADSLAKVTSLFDFSYYTINGTQIVNGNPQTYVLNLPPEYDYWLEFCRKNNRVAAID